MDTTTPLSSETSVTVSPTSRLIGSTNNTTFDLRYSNMMDITTSASETFTNFSESSPTSHVNNMPIPPLPERVIEALLLTAICIVAISGNTLLFAVVLRHRSLRTASNALVLCLSAADLLVSTASMPVTIVTISTGKWMFSDTLCIVLGFISMCTFIGSVMSLGAISINRYVLIVHPSKFKRVYTRRNTGFFVIGVWTLAVILALPPLSRGWGDYGFLPNQSFCFCRWRKSVSYTFFMVGVCFGGPCSVMTFCYINILKVVRQSRKRVASNPMPAMQQRPKKSGSPIKAESEKSIPSFCVNGNNVARSPSPDSVNPAADAVNGSESRQMLRSQLNELLRSKTIDMSQNALSQKNLTQNDKSDSDDSRPNSAGQSRSRSLDSTPEKANSFGPLKPKQREIKWIVPERKSSLASITGSLSLKDCEDNNSNKLNGSPRGQTATERSSLARLAVPLPTDLSRRKQRKKNRSESEKRRKEEELKLTKSFLVVIFVFVLCWFPFCLTMFWSVFSKNDNAVPRPVDMGTLLLGYLNSCCNPIIYGVMNKRFRAGYKSILYCRWRRKKAEGSNTTFQVDGINLNTSTMGSVG